MLQQPAVAIALGLALSLLCVVLAFVGGGDRKQAQRVDRLRSRGRNGGGKATELKLRRESDDKRLIDQLVRRLLPQPELLRQRLRRTGHAIGLGTYGVACLTAAAVTGLGMMIADFSATLAAPAALLAGLWLPHIVVGWLCGRRAMRFTVLFPEAIGLMVRSIKSGLPITEAFQIAGNEIADPVGLEFRQITDQIRLGQPIDQVMWDAAQRVGTPEMKFMVVTLSIQRETGGNLAETLENLDNILRRRRQMKLKIKAMSSEARASAMIIGALPFVAMALLSVANYEYIALLFTTARGHMMLAGGALSMGAGIAVMAKMVRFEI